MPAGTEAHQLVEVCQVGAALIILSFKPCQIDQQLSWSWLTCIGGNRHVSPPLTVLTLRHRTRSHLPKVGGIVGARAVAGKRCGCRGYWLLSDWCFHSAFPHESTNLSGAEPDLKWPLPIRGVGPVDAELVGVLCARDLLVEQCLPNAGPCDTETGYPVNSIHGQGEAVSLIADGEFQRRVDVALLLVAAHVNVVLTGPAVRESMDEPRVRVKVEDHGLVWGEKRLELTVGQTVGVFGMRHQFKQVNDVHEPDLHVGEVLAKQSRGGQGLHRRYVPATRHDDVGLGTLIVAGPIPDAHALGAVPDRRLH